jgi:hypothetical protein
MSQQYSQQADDDEDEWEYEYSAKETEVRITDFFAVEFSPS